jgi:hypothetical protein
LEETSVASDLWGVLHAQTSNTLKVVENLTPAQKKLLAESNNLNVFYPHIGIFSKDYFLSTILLKK